MAPIRTVVVYKIRQKKIMDTEIKKKKKISSLLIVECGQRRPSQTQKNEILSKIHARGKEEVDWPAPSLQHIQPGIVPTFFPPTQ